MAPLTPRLQPIVRSVETFQTINSWGIGWIAQDLLGDPDGNLFWWYPIDFQGIPTYSVTTMAGNMDTFDPHEFVRPLPPPAVTYGGRNGVALTENDVLAEELRTIAPVTPAVVPIVPIVPMGTVEPPVPLPPVPTIRIQVRVAQVDNAFDYTRPQDAWIISLKVNGEPKDIPQFNILKAFLPPEHQHFLSGKPRRYENHSVRCKLALSQGLPATALHDAIKAWAFNTFSPQAPVESDTVSSDNEEALRLIKLNGATIEVGGMVWKMVPTGVVNARPILKRIRERALSSSKAEAVIIKNRANQDAQTVVRNAEQRAQTLQQAVETDRRALREERARTQGATPPQWLMDSSMPMRRMSNNGGYYWEVGFDVPCPITDIRLTFNFWETSGLVLHYTPTTLTNPDDIENYRMPLWYKLRTDQGVMDNVHADHGNMSVHIADRCCMVLQGVPRAITSQRELMTLANVISRGLMIVNLNSPLSRDWQSYFPIYRAQLPEPVRKFLSRNWPIVDRSRYPTYQSFCQAHPELAADRVETVSMEADRTFTVEGV